MIFSGRLFYDGIPLHAGVIVVVHVQFPPVLQRPAVAEPVGKKAVRRAPFPVERVGVHAQQQRVGIARALVTDPDIVFADEPTGNLDEDTATGILNLLMRINSESGTAIIMVTHNREICRKWPGRIFEIKEETCTEITTGPEIRQEKEEEKSDEAE